MHTLEELQERRAYECRLTSDRALETLEDAQSFLIDRGLLTRATDSELPSLFEACHEAPYAARSSGFGQWPATKYVWYGQLGARGYAILNVHRGKNLMITDSVARLIDPICRAELDRMERENPRWGRLLRHLDDAGPSELDDLQRELALNPKELKQIRSPLERCGAIVSRSIVYEDPHRHTSQLARWDQIYPTGKTNTRVEISDIRRSLADLLVAAVRAAVVAHERELPRWFSWKWYWDDLLLEGLITKGRLQRIGDHVTAPAE
jgi:hypothetical protein